MPYLEIKACVDCPHSFTSTRDQYGNNVGDENFYIKCEHTLQTEKNGFVAKMKNQRDHIYFKCPLITNEEIEDDE